METLGTSLTKHTRGRAVYQMLTAGCSRCTVGTVIRHLHDSTAFNMPQSLRGRLGVFLSLSLVMVCRAIIRPSNIHGAVSIYGVWEFSWQYMETVVAVIMGSLTVILSRNHWRSGLRKASSGPASLRKCGSKTRALLTHVLALPRSPSLLLPPSLPLLPWLPLPASPTEQLNGRMVERVCEHKAGDVASKQLD